ncbi:replication initiation protein [Desulfobacter hydrogenophilus]|uniref:replication initiation protein n=1 Tax=Desulfobacter hydrogenophilus TaxID=2291 RepID=UPI0014787AAB|nr:replication initiation protein [Desulfobacter hydrogenophilus]
MVCKSNALCRASWSPDSIWESRLVALIATQVREDDEDFKGYWVPVSDIINAAEIKKNGKVYKALDELTDKAMGRVIKIKESWGWNKYTLFSTCKFIKKDNAVILGFHPDLKPHYLALKKHFTKYALAEFLALPSTYSQRVYEILRSWDERDATKLSMEDLHEILCTPPSMRKNFGEFKRRVLDKALKDIEEKTPLRWRYEPIKKGRKVIAVRFFFGKKSRAKAESKAKKASQQKQSKTNNALFLAAVQCAADHPDGCGQLRGTKNCCKICMEKK